MKEPNANGDGKSLAFLDGDFEFYCLQLKIQCGFPKFYLVGMRVQCSFPMGMKFQGIFLTGDKFSVDFSGGEGVPPGL